MAVNGFSPNAGVERNANQTGYRCTESSMANGSFDDRCEGIGKQVKCQDQSVVGDSGVEDVGILDGLSAADIARLRRRVRDYEQGIQLIDQRCWNIEHECDAVKRNIHQFVEALIASLHRREEDLITKAADECTKSLEQLQLQKKELLTRLEELQGATLQREDPTRTSKDTERVCKQQGGHESAEEKVYLYPIENIHFDFYPCSEVSDLAGLGDVVVARSCPERSSAEGGGLVRAFTGLRTEFLVKTRNTKGKQVYCYGDHLSVNIRSQTDEFHVKTLVEDNRDGSYSVSYLAEREGLYDISVVLNGAPVTMPLEPVTVTPRLYSPTIPIGQQGTNPGQFRKPWGVAVNDQDLIAVADLGNNRIQVLNSGGELIHCFGKNGRGPGEFNGPCDIAWGQDGQILVSDSGNHRIQTFSSDGKFINSFGTEGNLNGELCFPHSVSSDSHGNIVVADTGNKRIQVFTPEGSFKFAIDRGLRCPMSCIFVDDHFVVSDAQDHRVKVFSASGKLVREFGAKGNTPGAFSCPVGLAVDKAGHILACDRGNSRVQLFHLDGNFHGEFGAFGCELGHFAFPCSVAVLSDGRFVVSELENGRLQVFE